MLTGYQKPEDLIGENGLLKQLTKALVECALEAEMPHHLAHAKHEAVNNPIGNTRNGKSRKILKGDFGETGFDDKIISLYARGLTVREILSYLQELYGIEISSTLIYSVTDAVIDEVKA